MEIFIERDGRHEHISFTGSGTELCAQLGIEPETIVLVRNGEIVTEDTQLTDEDTITLLSVISGG